jgi:hypothetical protein
MLNEKLDNPSLELAPRECWRRRREPTIIIEIHGAG